ncbi:MAG: hypothetical protein MJ252_01415 [archaeon]|nr:hypothetical protein [archaeon]
MQETDTQPKEEEEKVVPFFLGEILKECNALDDQPPVETKSTRKIIELEDKRIVEYPRALLSELSDKEKENRRKEDQMEAEARAARKEKLEKIYQQEMEVSKVNRMKLLYDWKIIMRIAKIDEIRKYLTLYMQIFERDLDDKDAILQMLDRDIIEAEDHYNIALTNHFIHVKQLVSLQDSRIKGLFREFEIDVTELETEFLTEFTELKKHFELEQREITKMFRNILEEYKKKFKEIAKEFQDVDGGNQTRINEEYSRIQDAIRKTGADVHNKFAGEMTEIKTKSEEENKKDQEGIQRLIQLDKEVAALKKKFDKQNEDLKQYKIKIKQNNEDWDSKNENLKSEKEKIMRSYRFLKDKLIAFRNDQKDKLKRLVKNSFDCETKLKNYIKLAEKILKLAEISRRLEIEREKILPYYENSNAKKDTEEEEEIAQGKSKNNIIPIAGVDPSLYEEIESLQNFWKRYNKVKLDVIAIKKQKAEIECNNEFLKNCLQNFYDGFHVNNVVMTNANPLLVVVKKEEDEDPKNLCNLPGRQGALVYQECNNIVDDVGKQRRFALGA